MLGRISKQLVDKLAPGSLVWDTSLVGFGVRRQLRHPHYVVRYRINGKQKLVTIGKHGQWTPETARRKAQELLGIVATGKDPGAKPVEGDSFAAIADRFLARQRARLKPRSYKEVERYLRKHASPLHNLALPAITRRDIASALSAVHDRSGVVARNRFRSTLSALFRWAIEEGWIDNSPVTGTREEDEGSSRERVLTEDEIRQLWLASDGDFGAIVRLLLLTGQRRNEIGLLRWDEMDLTDNLIVLPRERTKNGREHILPLSRQAQAILSAQPRRGDSVFASQSWANSKVRLDAKLKIADWRLHDLRRTCATHLAELGVFPHVIEAVLNHQSGHKAGIAGVYNRSKLVEPIREALQKWADHLDQINIPMMERSPPLAHGPHSGD
jgi:integrase